MSGRGTDSGSVASGGGASEPPGGEEEDTDVGCFAVFGRSASMPDRTPTGDGVVKRGFLVKQGHLIRNWKRRSFVLTTDSLKYFDAEGSEPKGVIPLKDIDSVKPTRRRGSFEIKTTSGKDFAVMAASDAERATWMAAIVKAKVAPSRTALLMREAGELAKLGLLPKAGEDRVRALIASGDPAAVQLAQAELARAADAGRAQAGSAPLEGALRAFGDARGEAEIVGALRVLREALGGEAVYPSFRARVSAAAARHHASSDGAWGDEARRAYAAAVAVIREVGRGDGGGGGAGSGGGGGGGGDGATPATDAALEEHETGSDDGALPSPEGAASGSEGEQCPFDDDYALGRKIGEGGYSTVYEARHRRSGALVAVKVVEKKRLDKAEAVSFRREVRMHRRLHHRNIVGMHAFYNEGERYCIVMDLMGGGELFDRIVHRSHYSEREARDVVKVLAKALAYCHKKGIAHRCARAGRGARRIGGQLTWDPRDLKPENILMSSNEEGATIKLADMGFAQVVPDAGLTTSCGTPSYVAPEILQGKPYGTAVDLWSLGIITYILLCGYAPFANPNQSALFRLICRGSFTFDPAYWDNVSEPARDFIRKLLVVDPLRRLTAKQALRHKWIAGLVESRELSGVVDKMKLFNESRRTVIKRGFLVKRGHFFKNWKRRSFVLTGSHLEYYEDEETTKPKGVIALRDIVRVKAGASENTFRIETSAGKSFTIAAASEAEKDDWMRLVTSANQRQDLIAKAEVAMRADDRVEAMNLMRMAQQWESFLEDPEGEGGEGGGGAAIAASPVPGGSRSGTTTPTPGAGAGGGGAAGAAAATDGAESSRLTVASSVSAATAAPLL